MNILNLKSSKCDVCHSEVNPPYQILVDDESEVKIVKCAKTCIFKEEEVEKSNEAEKKEHVRNLNEYHKYLKKEKF